MILSKPFAIACSLLALVPASLSLMCAYETPAEGGQTLIVSVRAAYDRLDEDRRAQNLADVESATGTLGEEAQQIFRQQYADDLVPVLPDDREPGMP